MNWDIIIGLIIGLSGTLITLAGTIITNKQNHKHELTMYEKKADQELKTSIQRLALENSFKEYEYRTNLGREIAASTGSDITIYPYDMYLVTYSKIAQYLIKENATSEDLVQLLRAIEDIKSDYDLYGRE